MAALQNVQQGILSCYDCLRVRHTKGFGEASGQSLGRHLVLLVKVMIRGSGTHNVSDCPHKDGETGMCVCCGSSTKNSGCSEELTHTLREA